MESIQEATADHRLTARRSQFGGRRQLCWSMVGQLDTARLVSTKRLRPLKPPRSYLKFFFRPKKSPSLCLALACSGSTLLVAQSRLPELDSSTSADPATRSRMSKNCCGECPHMWTFARQNGEPHHATEQRFHEKITSQTTRIITFLNPAKSGGTIPPGCFACNFDRQGLES